MSGDRLDRLDARLRQVLELLANASATYTTIPSPEGAFQGSDRFVGPELIDEASAVLAQWDEEDEEDDADDA